ncbi:hypothetical protein A2Y85_04265 [candidate division WOR-3 bacterium RBG_13_43_14]|uniref:Rubrerythrin diiron-binding domain-containing protein n=1 Tax=candidate division WOR-3 bacterium RBG_13_43_14 TaxID=1802590 RepID=A0A1F4UAS5_UNCW3|nr:MAG: hypothetical protein A2Y85_04265 [candidate division WOR-3 bacterium RBG_13_43_14]
MDSGKHESGEKMSQDTNIVREAIKLEINGRAFFEHAARQTGNELGKKMFTKLANDEIQHLKVFGDIFSSVVNVQEWKSLIEQEETNKSELIEQLKKRMHDANKNKSASELEAISIGMELERKAIDFFDKSANETSDPKLKQTMKKISDEEKFHFDLLQAQYDNVTNSGFWFDIAEFRMDGKY